MRKVRHVSSSLRGTSCRSHGRKVLDFGGVGCHTHAVSPDLRHKPAALQRGCDLTGVLRKSLLRLLGEHCADAGERHALLHLSSRGGRDAYNAQVCCHHSAAACSLVGTCCRAKPG